MTTRPTTTTITVMGETIDVTITPDLTFIAEIGENQFYADKASDLEEKLKRFLRKAKAADASIPVVLVSGGELLRATLRRRHAARYRTFLFEGADGKKFDLDYPRIVARGSAVTDEQIAAVNAMQEQITELQTQHNKAIADLSTERLDAGDLLDTAAALPEEKASA